MSEEFVLSAGNSVIRSDDTVTRPRDAWSENRQAFLRHLEARGLTVEHMRGLTPESELYDYVTAEKVHPQRWSDAGLYAVGELTRRLHDAGREFIPTDASASGYKPWCLREIGGDERVWCHGDIAPWNMLTKSGMPLTLVDWEYAGPLDPLTELARVCWLFPQLVDDDLGALYELPSPEGRARQVRLICDGYRLDPEQRHRLTEQILEVMICETAHEAIDPGVTFDTRGELWGFAWRTRSAYWVWRNRAVLERALV